MRRIACLGLLWMAAACAAQKPASSLDYGPPAQDIATQPAPLSKSVFARTPQGSLTEDKLQQILESPLQLELPARVGVLPIIEAEDWRGPGPSYEMVSPALSAFAKTLPADDGFRTVTEMMPIPSGALGMEALREVAARYKLRYLLLYREDVERTRRGNGIATGYATVVGAFFLPGSTLEVQGYSEASLFEVKTGLLLFTVRRRLERKRRSNVWQRDRKLHDMQEALAVEAAGKLAKDARTALARLQDQPDDLNLTRPPAQADPQTAIGP